MKDADKSIEQIDAEIAKLAEERNQLFRRIKPFEDLLVSKYRRIEKLTELRDTKKIQTGELDWPALLEETGNTGMAMYREAEKRLREYGLGHSGYIPETQQRCIRVSVAFDASDEDLAKKAEGIKLILPHLKVNAKDRYRDGEGIYIDVMEDTLSEHGSYGCWYVPKTGKWELWIVRYGSPSKLSTHDSIEEFLLMLKDKHPYPGPERDYWEDD